MTPEPEQDRRARRASEPDALRPIPVRGVLDVGDARPPRKDVDALGKLVEAMRDELEEVRDQVAALKAALEGERVAGAEKETSRGQ